MKPFFFFFFFFIFHATSKTFKIFRLYGHGQLTFMKSTIIRIAAKFQYNTIRTLSHGLEVVRIETVYFPRKILKPERCSWCEHVHFSAPTWEIGAEKRSVECYYYHYYCCCFRRWWYLLLGLLVLWPSISSLLQSATSVITKCDGLLLLSATIKCDRYYKVQSTKCPPPPRTRYPGNSIGKAKHTN